MQPTTFLAVLPNGTTVSVWDSAFQQLTITSPEGVLYRYHETLGWLHSPDSLASLFSVLSSPSWTEDEITPVLHDLGFV